MKNMLRDICSRELNRLNDLSLQGPLELEDVKKIEILTRSLKQLEDAPPKQEELDDFSKDDLLSLARLKDEDNGSEIKPEQKTKGNVKGRRKKAGD